MKVRRCDHPMEFLAVTAGFRASQPVMSNVIGSIATSVARGAAYEDCFWWVIEDAGEVVGCAMRTVPWRLAIPDLDPHAARALGEAVVLEDPGVPGVNGPRPAVDAVYQGMGVTGGVEYGRSSHALVLDELRPAPAVSGSARLAVAGDLDLVTDWFQRFEVDIDAVSPDDDARWRERVATKVADRAVLLWDVDGRSVSLAGHAPAVDGLVGPIARIGPVYTPHELRRRGFGTAVTSALVQRLLPQVAEVMLYADAANPTSNGIYASLGFRRQATVVETTYRRVRA